MTRNSYQPFRRSKITLTISEEQRYKLAVLSSLMGLSASSIVNTLLTHVPVENWESLRSNLLDRLVGGEDLQAILQECKREIPSA